MNLSKFEKDGYDLVTGGVSKLEVEVINAELAELGIKEGVGGERNADKKFQLIGELALSEKIQKIVAGYLGKGSKLVRSILFNKSSENNWLVSWHQDKTVAVSKKFDLEGWNRWTVKDGVNHVQPPLSVIEDMATLRIHLDKAGKENGCLKVIPGSHKMGLMPQAEIDSYIQDHPSEYVEADVGDILVMKPNILHSSSKTASESRRRVVHFEFCKYELPEGVGWV